MIVGLSSLLNHGNLIILAFEAEMNRQPNCFVFLSCFSFAVRDAFASFPTIICEGD